MIAKKYTNHVLTVKTNESGAVNFILFGPPGMGKTSLINLAKSFGIPSFDLEDLPTTEARYEWLASHQGYLVGAADIDPKRFYKYCFKLILHCSESTYAARRLERDLRLPVKASQPTHTVSKWYHPKWQHRYHYAIDTSHGAHDSLRHICLCMLSVNGNVWNKGMIKLVADKLNTYLVI